MADASLRLWALSSAAKKAKETPIVRRINMASSPFLLGIPLPAGEHVRCHPNGIGTSKGMQFFKVIRSVGDEIRTGGQERQG